MDFSKDDVYDKTKSALVKYKSKNVCSGVAYIGHPSPNIKPDTGIKTENASQSYAASKKI